MGGDLADGMADGVDGEAHSRDLRTAPLIGLRFNRTFLHDGRAQSVAEAVNLHRGDGSEASDVIDAFLALAPEEQTALTDYVSAL